MLRAYIHDVRIVIFVKNILLQALKQLFRVLIFSKFHIFLYIIVKLVSKFISDFWCSFLKNVEKQLTMQFPSPGTLFIVKKASLFTTILSSNLGFFVIMTSSSSLEEITTNCISFILNTTKDLIFLSKVNCVFLLTRGAGVVSLKTEIQLLCK